MDPWSSNEWIESSDSTLSAKPQLDLHSQPSPEHANLPSSSHPWPVPDFSLPSWDTPSPPKSNSPIPGSSSFGALSTPVTESTDPPSITNSSPKLDQITTLTQTLTLHTQPTSPTNSFRTAGSANSDQWAESNQSPTNELDMPSHQSTSELPIATADRASPTAIAPASTSVDLSHSTSVPDDVRWGSFNQPEILPISSTISYQPDSQANFSQESPTQTGWNGETNLSGWHSGVADIDHSLPSLETSLHFPSQDGQDIHSNQINTGCSSSDLSDSDNYNQENVFEPAWGPSESQLVYQSQEADQQMDPNQSPDKHHEFLSSCQAATNSDISSIVNSVGKLAGTCGETPQAPLSDASAIQTQNSFQNSSPSDAFQSAISMTAQVAANMIKSANKPRRFFGNVGTSSFVSQHSSIQPNSPETLPSGPDQITWGDFAALEAPISNSAASGEASTQQQSEQKPRASFFRLWASKPSQSKAEGASSIPNESTFGSSPLPPQNSHHQSRDSVSSTSTSSTVWPAPSPASSDPSQSCTTSTMSRLFGRFGSRSNTTSIDAFSSDDHSAVTTPSTELDANEAQILDFFQSVPIEPQSLHEDDLPLGKIVAQSKLNGKVQQIKPPLDVFDLLPDNQVTPNLRASIGSRQLLSSQLSSSSTGPDPFDFINTRNSNIQSHSSQAGATSSGSRASWSRLDSSSSSYSQPINQLNGSGVAVGGQTAPGDDLDDIFSAFQGPATSVGAQGAQHSVTGIYKESGKVLNRLSTPTISSMKSVPKPVMNNLSTPQGVTQVRMANNNPQPILRQTSERIETGSMKIPMLPPPPSSLRSAVPSSRPLTSPPQNKPLAFSLVSNKSSSIPLIPPPQNNVYPSVQKPTLNYSHSIPLTQNSNQFSPLSTPSVPHLQFSATTNTPQNLNRPIQTGQSLTKEDLSFFDSLL